jgi:hypothetical protein
MFIFGRMTEAIPCLEPLNNTIRLISSVKIFLQQFDPQDPLILLSSVIPWVEFNEEFSPFFAKDIGRPIKLIRLMVGLLILKYFENISDHNLVLPAPESVTPERRSAQAIESSLLPKNWGEPMGAPAILKQQIEIKLLHSASTEGVTDSGSRNETLIAKHWVA